MIILYEKKSFLKIFWPLMWIGCLFTIFYQDFLPKSASNSVIQDFLRGSLNNEGFWLTLDPDLWARDFGQFQFSVIEVSKKSSLLIAAILKTDIEVERSLSNFEARAVACLREWFAFLQVTLCQKSKFMTHLYFWNVTTMWNNIQNFYEN